MYEAKHGDEPPPYHFDISELGDPMTWKALHDMSWKSKQAADIRISYFDAVGIEMLCKDFQGVTSLDGATIVRHLPYKAVAFVARMLPSEEIVLSGVVHDQPPPDKPKAPT